MFWLSVSSSIPKDATDSLPTSTSGTMPAFVCPEIFKDETSVEISDDIFVTCAEVKPYYEAGLREVYGEGAGDAEGGDDAGDAA